MTNIPTNQPAGVFKNWTEHLTEQQFTELLAEHLTGWVTEQ